MVDKLEKIQRNFLWSARGSEKNRLSLVSWDTICKPKSRGGLGVRRISNLNNILLTKVGWNLMKEEATRCKILKAKYLGNLKFSHCIWRNDLPMGSKIWGNIVRNRSLLREGMRWLVGYGNHINFWEDPWLAEKPLTRMKCESLQDHL
jgi:hypothetical protein